MKTQQLCLYCANPLFGRIDKKFCDDHCRSYFNNKINSDLNCTIRNINHILRKNRRILAALVPLNGRTKIGKTTLSEFGFNFRYFTHYQKSPKGSNYKICYDYGYINLNPKTVAIIHTKKQKGLTAP